MAEFKIDDLKVRLRDAIKEHGSREKFVDEIINEGDEISLGTVNIDCNPSDKRKIGIDRLALYCKHLHVSSDYLLFGSSYESWGNNTPSDRDVLKAIHVLFKKYGDWFIDGGHDRQGNYIMRDEFDRAITTIEFVSNGINQFVHDYSDYISSANSRIIPQDIKTKILDSIVASATVVMADDEIIIDNDGNVLNRLEVKKDG